MLKDNFYVYFVATHFPQTENFLFDVFTPVLINTASTGKSLFKKHHSFLNRELYDLRKIYVLNLKTGCTKKMPYVGEFQIIVSWQEL